MNRVEEFVKAHWIWLLIGAVVIYFLWSFLSSSTSSENSVANTTSDGLDDAELADATQEDIANQTLNAQLSANQTDALASAQTANADAIATIGAAQAIYDGSSGAEYASDTASLLQSQLTDNSDPNTTSTSTSDQGSEVLSAVSSQTAANNGAGLQSEDLQAQVDDYVASLGLSSEESSNILQYALATANQGYSANPNAATGAITAPNAALPTLSLSSLAGGAKNTTVDQLDETL